MCVKRYCNRNIQNKIINVISTTLVSLLTNKFLNKYLNRTIIDVFYYGVKQDSRLFQSFVAA